MENSLQRPARDEVVDLTTIQEHDAHVPSKSSITYPSPLIENDDRTLSPEDLEKGEGPAASSTASESDDSAQQDPNIVDFDGPDDPENPLNWGFSKKWGMVLLISVISFLTPLASSMFAPGVPEVMAEFNSTSDMLQSFMVSVYVLGFAFGPLVIAPLSEMYGRLPLYHSSNFFFVIFTIAAAVATNMEMFIVFRFLMGTFGGAPVVLGGGTIADLITREQRGTAMAIWMMGPTIGPCVGPIIGGFLTVAKGWRWNFLFVAIVGGACFVCSLILMSETSAPMILERKARKLRAETGNDKLRSKMASDLSTAELFRFSIVRPAKMLTGSTICCAISVYVAVTYTYLYILFATFSAVFREQYNWRGGITGLSFLGLGVGSLIGQFAYMHFGNKTAAKHLARGDFTPEHRLYTMCSGGFFMPIGLFIYGWSAEYQTHWMVPLLGTDIIGIGMLMTFMSANTYLIDVFTRHAASAMAANTVLRSLMAALVPLSSQKMYAAMGLGWGNSLLAFVSLALVPIPFLFLKYGKKIRSRSTVKL